MTGDITTPAWTFMVMDIAERYRKGVPPVAGGSLDQTNWINRAANFIDGERATHLGPSGAMAMVLGM